MLYNCYMLFKKKSYKNGTNGDLCEWPMVSWKSSGCNSLTKFLLCRVLSQSSSTDAKSMLRRHNEVFNTFVSISLRTLCESVTKLHSLIICSGEFSLITTPSLSNRVGVHLEVCKRTFSSLELGELLFLGFLNDESQWECDNIGSLGRSDPIVKTESESVLLFLLIRNTSANAIAHVIPLPKQNYPSQTNLISVRQFAKINARVCLG